MKNEELQAARKLLMLEVSEAAKEIGNCTPRTWQRWEDGTYSVPDDVAGEVSDLLLIRANKIEDAKPQKWYRTIEDYAAATGKRTVTFWRITQSVYAHQLAETYLDQQPTP